MQNVARNVIVQLELKYSRERIVVVIRRIIIDVRLGSGIAKFFTTRRRWLDALEIKNLFPPSRVPLIRRKIMRVNVRLPIRHRAAGEINEWHRAGECVVQKECS